MLIGKARERRGLCSKLRHTKCDIAKKTVGLYWVTLKKNNRGERLDFVVGTP